ncbi:MAG: DUF6906 family protein [Ruminiclostridium sp.]
MKHGKVPTVAQKKLIASCKYKSKGLNPDNWLVIKNLPDKLVIRRKERCTVIIIPRGGGVDAKHITEDSKCT